MKDGWLADKFDDSLFQECKFAQLAACEHMTFREFIEAILRCALILFPLEGMRLPDVDMFPQSCFVAQGNVHVRQHAELNCEHTSIQAARSCCFEVTRDNDSFLSTKC